MKEEIFRSIDGQGEGESAPPEIWLPSSEFIPLDEIPERPLSWLWAPFVVGNGITMLEGRPGTSKTTLATLLAAHVTSGGDPYTVGACLGGTIYISGEDDPASVLRPRIEAAGGDLRRVRVYDPLTAVRDFSLPDGVARLESVCEEIDARLVVIDPLSAFVSGSTANERAARKALTPLMTMALRCNVAVLILRHLNKAPSKDPLNAGSGSNAITGIARSVLQLSRSDDRDDVRILTQIKGNHAPLGGNFRAFTVEDGGNGHPVIDWEGISEEEAEQIAESSRNPRERPGKIAEAAEFLLNLLRRGTRPAGAIRSMARIEGISIPTLLRAKSKLHILTKKDSFEGGWVWYLGPDSGDGRTSGDGADEGDRLGEGDQPAHGDHLGVRNANIGPENPVDSAGCGGDAQGDHPVGDAEDDHLRVDYEIDRYAALPMLAGALQ